MQERSLAGPLAHELATEVLRAGGGISLVATGHSMTPAIRSGDRLTIEPLHAGPRMGAVLACTVDRRLVIHRVVGRRGGRVELRGDVAPASDGTLPIDSVLGAVTRVDRGRRRIRLGLGPERVLFALFSRLGLLRATARTAACWRLQIQGALFGSRISANIPHAELRCGRG
jgi:hypothetical protein